MATSLGARLAECSAAADLTLDHEHPIEVGVVVHDVDHGGDTTRRVGTPVAQVEVGEVAPLIRDPGPDVVPHVAGNRDPLVGVRHLQMDHLVAAVVPVPPVVLRVDIHRCAGQVTSVVVVLAVVVDAVRGCGSRRHDEQCSENGHNCEQE
jgi:hypothetical protein